MTSKFLSIFTLFLIISFVTEINAQYCATPSVFHEFDTAAFEAFKKRQKTTARSRSKKKIGITIHIVEEVAGASNIDIATIYEEVDAINRFFTNTGVEFFLCGTPRITQGKSSYTIRESGELLNAPYHIPNTINIFYVDEIGDQQLSSFACGVATLPFYGKAIDHFIVMQKSCSVNGTTLAHEIGHFFGLLHTHHTSRGEELVDGSNCDTAGDLVCDTPADPNLGEVGLNGCTYEGNHVDANGDKYRPSSANIMSYAPTRCRSRFTPGQSELMNFYLETTDLADLITDCDFYPDFSLVSNEDLPQTISSGQTINLTYLFENEGITDEKEVEISFSIRSLDEEGSLTFTIHKEIVIIYPDKATFEQTFAIELPLEFGTGQYQITTSLDPNFIFLERDKRNNFHDFTIDIDNSALVADAVYPNPVRDRATIFLKDGRLSGEFVASLHDYLGRTYHEQVFFKNKEELLFQINTSYVPAGLYILTVRFKRNGDQRSYVVWKE